MAVEVFLPRVDMDMATGKISKLSLRRQFKDYRPATGPRAKL